MTPRFASYDPQGDGLEFHDTYEKAVKSAEESIDQYHDSDAGWDEDVNCVRVFAVLDQATMCNRREADEDGNEPESGEPWPYSFDVLCEYKLQPPDPPSKEANNQLFITVGPLLFEFTSFQEWVNKAQGWFERLGGLRTVCVDAYGRVCVSGKEFQRAEDEKAFPVRVYAAQLREDQGSA